MTDVRTLIREQMAQAESFTTQEIAERVYTLLSVEGRKEALRIALPHLVRDLAVATRPHSSPRHGPRTPGSSKVAGIRRGWQAQVEALYSTGVAMKRLGDFTADDLSNLAATARDLAMRNAASAQRFEKLHAAMGETGVERVRDLPESVLSDILDSGDDA